MTNPSATLFSELNLSKNILRAVEREGYSTPTPIQAQVIPAMLAGRDILGLAQTGTGKTAAFVLPLLHDIDQSLPRQEHKCASTLILAPTRELAGQIADNIRIYGRFIQHSLVMIVGGARMGPQIKTLGRGNDIIVATPGRLLDHLENGHIRLDRTTHLILDEADQMLDMGFIPAIRKIVSLMPRERQTALLSATMPRQIRALANDLLKNPLEISVAQSARPIERIVQKIYMVKTAAKTTLLCDMLRKEEVSRAIIFTRTKRGADKLVQFMDKAGFLCTAIHGDKNQRQRDRALKDFRSGETPLLIATDVAARGIDVDDVSHVFNFDMPLVAEGYVHRIGRTARAGKNGVAISLCNSEERGLLRDIERTIGATLDKFDGETFETIKDELPPVALAKRASKAPQRHRKGGSGRPQSAGRAQPTGRHEGSGRHDGSGRPHSDEKRKRPNGQGRPDKPPFQKRAKPAPRRAAS